MKWRASQTNLVRKKKDLEKEKLKIYLKTFTINLLQHINMNYSKTIIDP